MGTEEHGHPEWSDTAEAPGEAQADEAATGEATGADVPDRGEAEAGAGVAVPSAEEIDEQDAGDDEGAGADGTAVDESAVETDDGDADGSIKRILEAALLVAGRPLSMNDMEKLFGGSADAPPRNRIRAGLAALGEDWQGRSLELQEVATGYRAQVRNEFEPWIARLWDEKPPRYSRALLETLAIIAYRQPMTRSEIEDIRGVSVSTQIIRTLTEREWIRVVGHREAPGRPAMYGTTREFLDYFNLKTLDQLPPISDIKDLEGQYPELGFEAEPASGSGRNAAGGETPGAEATDAAPGDGDAGGSTSAPDGAEGEELDAAPGPAESDEAGETKESLTGDEGAMDTARDEPTPEPRLNEGEPPAEPDGVAGDESGNDDAAET